MFFLDETNWSFERCLRWPLKCAVWLSRFQWFTLKTCSCRCWSAERGRNVHHLHYTAVPWRRRFAHRPSGTWTLWKMKLNNYDGKAAELFRMQGKRQTEFSFVTVKENVFMLTLISAFLPSHRYGSRFCTALLISPLFPDNIFSDCPLASKEKSKGLIVRCSSCSLIQ